jgi:Mn-dependent DtxR family transcriptional regulator
MIGGFFKMANTQNMEMTRSREDYLRVIYELSKLNKTIRSSDIADKLGITRPSVSRMMSELKNSGLIKKEKYGSIVLTEDGYKLAAQIKDKHDLIVSFLVDVLGVNKAVAKKDACKMEHAISQEIAERLNKQISQFLKNKEGYYAQR